jgi:dienelactone hydrolase
VAQILLFHHAQGLTPGVRRLAGAFEAAGHVVHVPDLYEGRTFDDLDEGVDHARRTGFGTIVARGRAAAEGLHGDLVLAGLSLGLMPVHALASSRPGVRGALLLHGFVGPWPAGVPAQIHVAQDDPEGDVGDAREAAAADDGVELFVYPGDAHLFTDDSLPAYEPEAAALVRERALAFLAAVA